MIEDARPGFGRREEISEEGVLAGDLARKAGKDSRAVRVAENRVEEEDQDGRQDPGVT